MIAKGTSDQLEEIMQIIHAATRDMEARDILQWDDVYPNADRIARDLATESLFAFYENGGIVGFIVLNEEYSPEYETVDWQLHSQKPLIVHRMCVDPQMQNRGIAKQLVRFAEDYARSHEYTAIRLDSFVDNPISTALYERMGYSHAGIVYFRKGPFYCLEKNIVTGTR